MQLLTTETSCVTNTDTVSLYTRFKQHPAVLRHPRPYNTHAHCTVFCIQTGSSRADTAEICCKRRLADMRSHLDAHNAVRTREGKQQLVLERRILHPAHGCCGRLTCPQMHTQYYCSTTWAAIPASLQHICCYQARAPTPRGQLGEILPAAVH